MGWTLLCAPSTFSSRRRVLIVALPILVLVTIVFLATSGTPLFYRGLRVGRYGRIFHMFKFRTLKRDAESRLGPYYGQELSIRTAAEVTRLGRWLRASQLDEMPQLWNVLRGDMSIVGPRPIRPTFFEELAAGDPPVLAASRRQARADRARADAHGPRGVVGGEARARSRVHRRPLGRPLSARGRRDGLARDQAVRRGRVGAPARRASLDSGAMCGICGLASLDGSPVDSGPLEAMNETLRHRGPDSAGTLVDGPVALASRRLSIIDLAGGDQPIGNEDGSIQVVQNGEIYNHLELRGDARTARAPLPHGERHRGPPAPLRGVRAALRPRAARNVRGRALGLEAPAARARPRRLRDQAAVLLDRGRHARLRVGAQGSPPRRGRPRRPRGLPRLQLDPGAAFDLGGDEEASCRPPARLGRRGRADSGALRASGPRPGGRRADGGRERAGRRAARAPARLGAGASARRRAGRRPALGRRRLGSARGACRTRKRQAGADVLDRLRRGLLRRARGCAQGRRALRHRPPRARRPARRGRAPAEARGGLRRAVRRLVGAAHVSRLGARRARREGGALRRGRRRALRRLPHLRRRPAGAEDRAAGSQRHGRSSSACRAPPPGRASTTGRSASSGRRTCHRSSATTAGRRSSRRRRARPCSSPTGAEAPIRSTSIGRATRRRKAPRSSRACRTSTSASTSSTTCS